MRSLAITFRIPFPDDACPSLSRIPIVPFRNGLFFPDRYYLRRARRGSLADLVRSLLLRIPSWRTSEDSLVRMSFAILIPSPLSSVPVLTVKESVSYGSAGMLSVRVVEILFLSSLSLSCTIFSDETRAALHAVVLPGPMSKSLCATICSVASTKCSEPRSCQGKNTVNFCYSCLSCGCSLSGILSSSTATAASDAITRQ